MQTERVSLVKLKREIYLHYTMAFTGGIFALYTLTEHMNVFGSAETGNMLLLVESLLSWDLQDVLLRLGSIAVYSLGIVFCLCIQKYGPDKQRKICMLTDCIAAGIFMILPDNMEPIVAVYPAFFAMSVQWCTFGGVGENRCATTFSTNNLRQLITAIFKFAEGKREEKDKIVFYAVTLFVFHLGAAMLFVVWSFSHRYAIGLVLIPLCAAYFEQCMIEKKAL